MKIRCLLLAAVLLTAFILMSGIASADDFAGGDGSADQPYKIANETQLQNIRNDPAYLDSSFILTSNIDLTGVDWTPVGSSGSPFTGTFDGAGYTISGLKINEPASDFVGFFSYSTDASFSNIKLTNISVVGQDNVGGLVGRAENSAFTDISVSGCVTISSNFYSAGSLAGGVWHSNFENCSVLSTGAEITTGSDYAGGFAGFVRNSAFIDCSVSGNVTVTAEISAGGFAGDVYQGYFENCSVSKTRTGSVKVTAAGSNFAGKAGGFAGSVNLGNFENCSVSGTGAGAVTVTANPNNAGGFVGYTIDSNFTNCFVFCNGAGSVTVTAGNNNAGGFAASAAGSNFTGCSVLGNLPGSATITALRDVGGFAGRSEFSNFEVCSVSGNSTGAATVIAGNTDVGGFAGYFTGTILNCYSEAAVKGPEYVGGLIGAVNNAYSRTSSITHSHFAGTIQVDGEAETNGGLYGGLVNGGQINIVDSFYIRTAEEYGVLGGTPVLAEEMKQIETFTLPLGEEGGFLEGAEPWDITNEYDPDDDAAPIWFIIEGRIYPMFTSLYTPPNNGGGSGFGEARVVDPPEEDSGLVTTSVPAYEVSSNSSGAGSSDEFGAADSGIKTDDAEYDLFLRFLLLTGLLLICMILFLIVKRRKNDDEEN